MGEGAAAALHCHPVVAPMLTNDGNKILPIFHFTQYAMLPHNMETVS